MPIMGVHATIHGLVSQFIGGTVHISRFDTSTGQPNRKTVGVMIAPVIILQRSLTIHRAAKFPATDYQGVIEESALLEIL